MEARYKLARMAHIGKVIPQDYPMAAKFYRPAAEQGHLRAQYHLAWLFQKGRGVPASNREVAKTL